MVRVTLTSRQREILRQILLSEVLLSARDLSSKLSLSPRVIGYNLPPVYAWLRMAGVETIHKPGVGIGIRASDSLRRRLATQLAGFGTDGLVLTADQRVGDLMLELLTRVGPISSQRIAIEEGVSRPTVLHDLDVVEEKLAPLHLQLVRRPRVGLWVSGPEASRRIALVDWIDTALPPDVLTGLWDRAAGRPLGEDQGTPRLRAFLGRLRLAETKELVELAERELGDMFTLRSRAALQLYLALAIDAVGQGRFVAPMGRQGVQAGSEFRTAERLATRIQAQFGLALPAEEVEILAALLLSYTRECDGSLAASDDIRPGEPTDQYLGLARSLVSEASVYLHPWLRVDPKVTLDLARHLACMIPRMRYGLPVRNPLLGRTRERYAQVFEAARSSIGGIEREVEALVPDEVVAVIALDLAAALERLRNPRRFRRAFVVGDSRQMGGAELVISRLYAEFPQLEIVGTSLDQVPVREKLEQAELIVSVARAAGPAGLPLVNVSPFVDRDDVRRILEVLHSAERKEHDPRTRGTGRPSLSDLLRVDCIQLDASASNWAEVVTLAGQPLVLAELVEPRYVSAMTDLIDANGPYMLLAPGVALLHARPADGVNTLCVGLLMLAEGVPFGHDTFDPVDTAFVLGAIDGTEHLRALSQLVGLIRDETFLSALRGAKTPAEVLGLVWRLQKPVASS